MSKKIFPAGENEYDELTALWEGSVRATHDFLTESDIQFFRPLVRNQFLQAVELYCMKDAAGRITGFIGIDGKKVEMLFIHPAFRGEGIGKALMTFAIRKKRVRLVDVNEQNPQAVGFYLHLGFQVYERSELDGMGKPFPILFMELRKGG